MSERPPVDRLPAALRARLRQRPPPTWVAPMRATLTDAPFSREGWLFEPKLDGERCLVFRRGHHLDLFSRNQHRLNRKYPEITAAIQRQATAVFVLDGELVAFEGDVTSFAKLQQRMQIEQPTADLLRRVPVWLYLFDLIYLDHYDTRRVPLRYRKQLLRDALDFQDPLRFTLHRERDGESYYRQACRRGWEGVMAKNGDSPYVSGRTREWLKVKCVKEQEFVIGGYTDPKGKRIGFGALLVGYYRRGRLVYAGKVGTGYDTATLRRLARQLARLERATSPFDADGFPRSGVHWVKPKLVAQIRFTEWTTDGKLRHPRFLGLRDDKRPQEVVREG
jgi:bifunctional non-homologous end joining protein LigD